MSRSSLHSNENKILVDFLIKTRKSQGITQVELAERLGKSQQFISRIESGERRIDLLEFVALSRCMGIDPAKLLGSIVRKLPAKFEV
jgi:transcriptional regulator with XRE-family HTH domain